MPQPFTLRVPDSDLADLRERLARTRFPDSAPGDPWLYGTERRLPSRPRRLLARPVRLARPGSALERLPAVQDHGGRTTTCTFCMSPGKGPNPTPLLLMHGWPGSVFEFLDFIPRLTDPASFGGDPADAFTVVAPSLPGYGLSFRPGQKRFGVEEIADCFADLMTDTLGYKRFAVQGGDWGGITAARIGYAHADKLIGIHVNFLAVRREPERIEESDSRAASFCRPAQPLAQGRRRLCVNSRHAPANPELWPDRFSGGACGLDRREISRLVRLRRRCRERLHPRPDARQHQLLLVHWRDRIVVLYLLFPRSPTLDDSRWRRRHGADRLRRISKGDAHPPRSLAEPMFTNIRRWTVMPKGGHFAAMEQPEALAQDVRAFFRSLRG